MQPLCRVDRQRKVIPGCALELLQRTDLTAQRVAAEAGAPWTTEPRLPYLGVEGVGDS